MNTTKMTFLSPREDIVCDLGLFIFNSQKILFVKMYLMLKRISGLFYGPFVIRMHKIA